MADQLVFSCGEEQVPYEEMYEDCHSAKYNIPFLHLASRVVKLIEDAGLQRVTPCMARDLFSES